MKKCVRTSPKPFSLGGGKKARKGDIVYLSDNQYEAFKDSFRLVDDPEEAKNRKIELGVEKVGDGYFLVDLNTGYKINDAPITKAEAYKIIGRKEEDTIIEEEKDAAAVSITQSDEELNDGSVDEIVKNPEEKNEETDDTPTETKEKRSGSEKKKKSKK